MRKRLAALLCALCLLVPLCIPIAGAEDIIFVAVNDTIPSSLNAASMPFYSDGTLYLPYTVFNNAALGVVPTYNVTDQTLMLANPSKQLLFSIEDGTVREDSSPAQNKSLIVRYGILFVPAEYCAGFFGISVSYLTSAGGYSVVRLKTGMEVYSDSLFIEKAENLISYRIAEYMPSDQPGNPSQSGQQTPSILPSGEDSPAETDVPPEPTELPHYCIAILGASDSLLNWFDDRNLDAAFFLTAEQISSSPDLVRRILGCGYALGIDARDCEDPQQAIDAANEALEQLVCTKTLLVLQAEASERADLFGFSADSPSLLVLEASDAMLTLLPLLSQGAQLSALRENSILPVPD